MLPRFKVEILPELSAHLCRTSAPFGRCFRFRACAKRREQKQKGRWLITKRNNRHHPLPAVPLKFPRQCQRPKTETAFHTGKFESWSLVMLMVNVQGVSDAQRPAEPSAKSARITTATFKTRVLQDRTLNLFGLFMSVSQPI